MSMLMINYSDYNNIENINILDKSAINACHLQISNYDDKSQIIGVTNIMLYYVMTVTSLSILMSEVFMSLFYQYEDIYAPMFESR